MALPLGAPCWVSVTRGMDIEPLKPLHQAIGSNQNSPKIATDRFESFLAKAESTLQDSLESRRELLAKLLQDRQAIDKRALVERFLWIMSTSELKEPHRDMAVVLSYRRFIPGRSVKGSRSF